MSKHQDDVLVAEQLLEILTETEKNKAYDLLALGEHLPVKDTDQLLRVARALEKQGCLRVVNLADTEGRLAVIWQKSEFQASSLGSDESIIVDASIQLTSQLAADIHGGNRGRSSGETESLLGPLLDAGDLTIGQVLAALSNAIRGSVEITDNERSQLIDMLTQVRSCEGIQHYLRLEVKQLLQS